MRRGLEVVAISAVIFAIVGTLSACGRYGRPVRRSPTETQPEAPADPLAQPQSFAPSGEDLPNPLVMGRGMGMGMGPGARPQ